MTRRNLEEWTMISVRKETLKKFKKLKIHPRQSYDEMICNMIKEKEKEK